MITVDAIREKSMTPAKKKNAKNDVFAFYVGRPISYYLTIPFLYLGIAPNMVSLLSLIPALFGLFFCWNNHAIIGCILFLFWNFMDGVDGNIARYTEQSSKLGALWDAASGYIAMICMYIAAGQVAFQETGNVFYISLGDFSALSAILARLLMHKRISLFGTSGDDWNRKENYGLLKIIALNIISYAGFLQVFLLFAAIFGYMWCFTASYFVLNIGILILTMFRLLRWDQ